MSAGETAIGLALLVLGVTVLLATDVWRRR